MINDWAFDSYEKKIMELLEPRKGSSAAYSKKGLIKKLNYLMGGSISDRKFRKLIEGMRLAGELICSKHDRRGGYFIAKDYDEYLAFEDQELTSRIKSLTKIRTAMHKSAKEYFGKTTQFEMELE